MLPQELPYKHDRQLIHPSSYSPSHPYSLILTIIYIWWSIWCIPDFFIIFINQKRENKRYKWGNLSSTFMFWTEIICHSLWIFSEWLTTTKAIKNFMQNKRHFLSLQINFSLKQISSIKLTKLPWFPFWRNNNFQSKAKYLGWKLFISQVWNLRKIIYICRKHVNKKIASK
jgi:hypothetical protein